MKKQALFPFIIVLFTMNAFGQQVGHLTVFNDDGDKFFLILNGERQNEVAQTNIRVEDLPNPQYSAKIIFEDQSLGEISKNLYLADENYTLLDVTYRIKRDKNGKPKIGTVPYSAIPVRQGFVAPANVYVVHYGVPAISTTTVAPSNTLTKTTTTTTTTGTPNTVGANVNINGINMGVSITDPTLGAPASQTTTTTTYSQTTSTNVAPPSDYSQPAGCVNAYPMNAGDFSSALSTVKNQGFDETRLKSAKQIASSNCLSTSQISQICQTFGFEESKLDFAKFAYDYCTEPKNYFKINNVFGFSSSVDDLNDYIQNR